MKKKFNGAIAELAGKIELEKNTIATLRQEMDAQEIEVARLGVTQKELAYPALTSGDAEAKTKLEECQTEMAQRQMRLASYKLAIDAAQSKLSTLEEQHNKAIIAQNLNDFAAMEREFIETDCEKLDRLLNEMTEVRDSMDTRIGLLRDTGTAAGLDVIRILAKLRINLNRCIAQRAQFNTVYLSRENREIFRGRVAVVAKSTLSGVLHDLDDEEKAAS